jgi:uncharacterized protein YndB with AHSA1/START domain
MRVLRRTAVYPHSVEDVWAGLTDRQALAEWLMPTTFGEARVGHRFRFQFDPEHFCTAGIVECEILACEPPHRMVWSWQKMAELGKPQAPAMQVEWRLTPEGTSTRVELVQTGLEGQPWLLTTAMSFGWRLYLRKYLPAVLRHIHSGTFTPGAISREKRAYRASNLPPEVAV